MKILFKNKKDIISYAVVAVISLTVCILLILEAVHLFGYISDPMVKKVTTTFYNASRNCFFLCWLCIVLIISFNAYHLLKLRAERLSPELKAKIASEAAEKKRLKLEKKAQSLQNEIDKLDDGDKQ